MNRAADLSVDIIVSSHNYGSFLPEAIDSALMQTHPAVRVIVVDDGSTDDSRTILKTYEGRVDLVLKENAGQASAFNAGFARSDGMIVIFLDADDVLRTDVAARTAAVFAARPAVAKVQFRMEVVDAGGVRRGAVRPSRHLTLPDGDVRDAELVFPFDLAWAPGNAYRASDLRQIFPLPEDGEAVGADWYLVHLTALLGHVASLAEAGALYRIHGRNGYELETTDLNLGHVRQAVRFARTTAWALERLSGDLGLDPPYAEILSVSDLANRLISRKLEPPLHPISGDRTWRLVLGGIEAAKRRFDVSWPLKALFVGWFLGMALAPRRQASWLAVIFLFPERRPRLNRFLRGLQRSVR